MTSLLFKIFAPLHTPRKLFSFSGVVLVLSLGVGIFLSIQVLLSNYNRSISLKVIEAKEEILVVRDPYQKRIGIRKDMSLRERMKIQGEEEGDLCDRIRSRLGVRAVGPFIKRDDVVLSCVDGGRSFTFKADLLIGIDVDSFGAVLPILDQISSEERTMFEAANIRMQEIPIFVSESLISKDVIGNKDFNLVVNEERIPVNIIGVLQQNELFPMPIVIVPLVKAKEVFRVTSSDGIGVRTFDEDSSLKISEQLSDFLGDDFIVQHWSEALSGLDGIFMAVNIIISLVVSSLFVLAFLFAVATFDILMKRKKKQLALLLAIGMSPTVIRSGLLRLGGSVGCVCCVIGFGVAYIFLKVAPYSPLAPVFKQMMIDDFSFRCGWHLVLVVGAVSLLVPLCSAWVAATRAFKIDPIEDLRR